MKVGADLDDDIRRPRSSARRSARTGCCRRRQPALGRRRGDRLDASAARVRAVLDRGADQPRRHPRPRRDRARRGADPRRDRRARPQPGDVQAALAGRGDRRLPDRRLPARRRQRGARGPADGRRVRRAGLPARRRRRPVRAGPAPVGHRLRLRQRLARGADDRVRRPPPRALRRPGRDPRWRVPRVPTQPGYSAEIRPESLERYRFPDGAEWRDAERPAVTAAGAIRAVNGAPERIDEYERLHADAWPGVLEQIRRSNIRNYTIFRARAGPVRLLRVRRGRLRGRHGAMAADPRRQQWWSLTDAMQEPLSDREAGAWWKTLPEVFHTD